MNLKLIFSRLREIPALLRGDLDEDGPPHRYEIWIDHESFWADLVWLDQYDHHLSWALQNAKSKAGKVAVSSHIGGGVITDLESEATILELERKYGADVVRL